MRIKSVANNVYLQDGEHDVTITKAEMENYTYGNEALAVTFANEKGITHKQLMPIVGFKTYLEEKGDVKYPDALTAQERKSGHFDQDKDEDGNVISKYAIRVKKENPKTKKFEDCDPERVISDIKSDVANDIIGRLANACGFGTDEELDSEQQLVGCQLKIVLEKKLSTAGNYMRVKKFLSLAEEEI